MHESSEIKSTFTDNIKQIVLEITRSTETFDKKKEKYQKLFPSFAKNMPTLFNACLQPGEFPLVHLDMMLEHTNSIKDKEDVIIADKAVYNKLREAYIDPIIPPDPELLAKHQATDHTLPNLDLNQCAVNVDVKQ